jgi:putative ABC transport system permease protein
MMGIAAKSVPPAFYMTWHILLGVGAAVLIIAMLASLLSIRRVIVLEPAIVFK